MKKRIIISITLLAILILFIPVTGTLGAPQPQAANTLKIGMLVRQGTPADLGARLAVNEINRRGNLVEPNGRVSSLALTYVRDFPDAPEDVRGALDFLVQQEARAIIGPSSDNLTLPNLEPLARSGVPVLTLSTSDTLTDLDVTNNIMRIRAAERYYSFAAASYMINDLGANSIALIQTNVESTEGLIAYESAMSQFGIAKVAKVQLTDGSTLESRLPDILAAQPNGIAMWGSTADVNVVLRGLRNAGWNGTFFYRHALDAYLQNQLDMTVATNILGASGWLYTTPTELSRQFLLNYITAYGTIPNDEAAAAYDAVYTLAGQFRSVGADMPALYESMRQMPPIFTVQGRLSPLEYGNGDFSRNVSIFRLTDPLGSPELLQRYQNTFRAPDDDLITEELDPLSVIGTVTDTPEPTLTPSIIPPITATPSIVQVQVIQPQADIYSGPAAFYDLLGQLTFGDSVNVVGATANYEWFVIQYQGGIGWVFGSSVEVFDPGGQLNRVPIIDPAPTPIGGVTTTPSVAAADIIIGGVSLTPPNPQPGSNFLINVSLQNNGTADTGEFTITAILNPGPIYLSETVGNLAAGANGTAIINATLFDGGNYTGDIAVDSTNAVLETPVGESNNTFTIRYVLEYPVVRDRAGVAVNTGENIALSGNLADLSWNGSNLDAINGARMSLLTGVSYDTATSANANPLYLNTARISSSQLFSGAIIAVITAEGQRAILRIDAQRNGILTISFRVYSA